MSSNSGSGNNIINRKSTSTKTQKEEELWTTVSYISKKKKNRPYNNNNRNNTKKDKQRQQRQKKNALLAQGNDDDDDDEVKDDHDNNNQQEKDEIINNAIQNISYVMKCIIKTTFYKKLLTSFIIISKTKSIKDIVCYGVGNFIMKDSVINVESSSSSRQQYSAPMLQLACVLLLQRSLTILLNTKYDNNNTDENDNENEQNDIIEKIVLEIINDNHELVHKNNKEEQQNESTTTTSLQQQKQQLIPIYYYEPLITSLEKELLTSLHNLNIIPQNERGKRFVKRTTLFFMPHCPMKLYCNVLLKNWNFLHQNVIIFGNSFNLYHDRLSLSFYNTINKNAYNKKLKSDLLFISIYPFCKEYIIQHKEKHKKNSYYNDENSNYILHIMENAFNDCNVMIFDKKRNNHDVDEKMKYDGDINNDYLVPWPYCDDNKSNNNIFDSDCDDDDDDDNEHNNEVI